MRELKIAWDDAFTTPNSKVGPSTSGPQIQDVSKAWRNSYLSKDLDYLQEAYANVVKNSVFAPWANTPEERLDKFTRELGKILVAGITPESSKDVFKKYAEKYLGASVISSGGILLHPDSSIKVFYHTLVAKSLPEVLKLTSLTNFIEQACLVTDFGIHSLRYNIGQGFKPLVDYWKKILIKHSTSIEEFWPKI